MGPTARSRNGWRNSIGIATTVASLAVCAGMASAGGGGTGGGTNAPDPPRIADVRCIETCGGTRLATYGSKVELTGRRLGHVQTVRFDRRGGGQVDADARGVSARHVRARVPQEARTGEPKVVDSLGRSAGSPVELRVAEPEELPEDTGFALARAKASPDTTYFDGRRDARVDYVFEGAEPTDVRIQVVDRDKGRVVRSFRDRDLEPYAEHRARWNGKKENGEPAGNGRYRFRIGPADGGRADTTDGARFRHYRFKFPLRGPHSYGDGIGAGRGHQGQDVFARCGTPIVAARGGDVQVRQYHSAAGYYLVVDGKDTGRDYVYMHMKERGRPGVGRHVHTGERVGYTSDTGNATGCHLHFEIWSSPGWYEGGRFTNPTDDLRQWDEWS